MEWQPAEPAPGRSAQRRHWPRCRHLLPQAVEEAVQHCLLLPQAVQHWLLCAPWLRQECECFNVAERAPNALLASMQRGRFHLEPDL